MRKTEVVYCDDDPIGIREILIRKMASQARKLGYLLTDNNSPKYSSFIGIDECPRSLDHLGLVEVKEIAPTSFWKFCAEAIFGKRKEYFHLGTIFVGKEGIDSERWKLHVHGKENTEKLIDFFLPFAEGKTNKIEVIIMSEKPKKAFFNTGCGI